MLLPLLDVSLPALYHALSALPRSSLVRKAGHWVPTVPLVEAAARMIAPSPTPRRIGATAIVPYLWLRLALMQALEVILGVAVAVGFPSEAAQAPLLSEYLVHFWSLSALRMPTAPMMPYRSAGRLVELCEWRRT